MQLRVNDEHQNEVQPKTIVTWFDFTLDYQVCLIFMNNNLIAFKMFEFFHLNCNSMLSFYEV